ncbi:MAG: site-2 protease family protein [Patescibacteria group bacterium]
MLISLLFTQPEVFFVWVLCVIIAISVHEFSHAMAGYLEGDDTAKLSGRLTFNPLAHIDWVGLILLIVVGFGWGKPVPFNPYNLKHKRFGPAIVALAGPCSNFILLVLVGLVLKLVILFSNLSPDNLLITFLVSLIQINLILMLFNLLPIPPLDGSKVLYTFLPYKYRNVIIFLETYGTWILLIFIFFGSSIFSWIFDFFYSLVLKILVL